MTAYHHGNLRAELTRAAVDLAREAGPDGVVIREVARRTGVSHNAAYRHFRDREALLGAVAIDGQRQLARAMSDRADQVAGSDEVEVAVRRLREVGRAYVGFALAEPGLFRTAFSRPPDEEVEEQVSKGSGPPADDPYALLGAALDEMVEVGAMPAVRREGAEILCWSAVHGFALLVLDGPLTALPEAERDRQLGLMLAAIETGLRAPG